MTVPPYRSTSTLSSPHVMYSARLFLKSACPSTAAYETRAVDPMALRYALISLAAALTYAAIVSTSGTHSPMTHAQHWYLTAC